VTVGLDVAAAVTSAAPSRGSVTAGLLDTPLVTVAVPSRGSVTVAEDVSGAVTAGVLRAGWNWGGIASATASTTAA
jgi:hypothetical protein